MDHLESFETLIDAYSQIAATLPRFDRLADSFRTVPEFQHVLAVFYADILEFHQEAYKFLRRPSLYPLAAHGQALKLIGWKNFFSSSWGRFNRRFKGILQSLSQHAELVDKEANAHNIQLAQRFRDECRRESLRRESEHASKQYQAILSWLEVKDSDQDDLFNALLDESYPGTCEWITQNEVIRSWLRQDTRQPFLWLLGKPGFGRYILKPLHGRLSSCVYERF